MNHYKELTTNESQIKNNTLADTLNTIQIASIVFTIVGWVLVIFQTNLPKNVSIYIFAIILCGIISIGLAMIIKNILGKSK